MNLFLDDVRHPDTTWMGFMYGRGVDATIYKTLDWDVVKTYDEFVDFITNNGIPQWVSFDHDLADEHYKSNSESTEKTGLECVKWLVEYCHDNNVPFPQWAIHSANPVGAENMESYILSALKNNYITETII